MVINVEIDIKTWYVIRLEKGGGGVIKLKVDLNKGTGMYVNADKKRGDGGRS